MTIDDFDLTEISSKLAIGDEANNAPALEASHDDGHQDAITNNHNDLSRPFWHDDASSSGHNDGHYDVAGFDDCCLFDDCCPPHDDCCIIG